jgi:hypothetical protein
MSIAAQPKTTAIAELMPRAAVELKVAVSELSYSQLKNWLKDEMDYSAEDIRAIAAHLATVGGFIQVRNAYFPGEATTSLLEKTELRGEAYLARKATAVVADQALFLKAFEQKLTDVFTRVGKLRPFGYSVKKSKEREERVVNLLLSDLHFGSWLDEREVPYRYGYTEEARRLASVVKRTCDFKTDYRPVTTLKVWLGGDIIKGLIHDMQSGASLAEQQADAIHLLYQALTILAGSFPRVEVWCSSGNHDRNVARHHDRATAGKVDSYATTVYVALKTGMKHLPNVRVNIPRTAWCEVTNFGRKLYLTHGDTNLNPGNPGNSIDVRKLENQMNRINAGEAESDRKPFEAFAVGHVHVGSQSQLGPGILLTNGALIPPDPYATSLNYIAVRSGQTLFESTPHRLVGDYRFLEVDKTTDKDSALDKFIVPWDGNF